jgi:hypothetical protein
LRCEEKRCEEGAWWPESCSCVHTPDSRAKVTIFAFFERLRTAKIFISTAYWKKYVAIPDEQVFWANLQYLACRSLLVAQLNNQQFRYVHFWKQSGL